MVMNHRHRAKPGGTKNGRGSEKGRTMENIVGVVGALFNLLGFSGLGFVPKPSSVRQILSNELRSILNGSRVQACFDSELFEELKE